MKNFPEKFFILYFYVYLCMPEKQKNGATM